MSILSREDLYTEHNVPKTASNIKELARDTDNPVFTLYPELEGYISLQKLFVSLTIDDPTEVNFAEEVFGDVGYWMILQKVAKLKPHIEKWREIAEMKRKQKAFKAIINEVEHEGKGKLQAAKFLIEEPWKNKRIKTTREASKKTTERAFNSVSDDYKRLREEGLLQ